MSDTFSSGFSTPIGAPQNPGDPASDVTSTLAELERKLRELERELTSIGRRRVRPEAAVGSAAAPEISPRDTGRLIDEQMEPQQPAAPVQAAQPPPLAPAEPMRRAAAAPAAELSAAEPEASRPTEAQLAILAELRRFRERLERFTKELTADYDAVLSRMMSGLSGRVAAEPSVAPASPPPAPRPPQASPPSSGGGSEETLFEGRVELGVGPFYDISSLGTFEQRLASLPYVVEVAVRRFEASHAVVDLRLATPVAFVSELRRVLDTDFSVRQVAAGRIQLAFDDA